MKYIIQLTTKAKKEINRLGISVKKRIDEAFRNMIDFYDDKEVPKPDVKTLKGKYQGLFRLRVGDIRVIFKMNEKELVILVIEVVKRGDAYKNN